MDIPRAHVLFITKPEPEDGWPSLDQLVTRGLHTSSSHSRKGCLPKSRRYVCLSRFLVTGIMHLGLSGVVLFVFCFPPKNRWQEWTQAFPPQLHVSLRGRGWPGPVARCPVHLVSFAALGVQHGWQQQPPVSTETAPAQAKEGPQHPAECFLWGRERLSLRGQGSGQRRSALGRDPASCSGLAHALTSPWGAHGSTVALMYS